ncbi:MAG: segregation/condensation protein A [Candidatus Hydrogenedentes bacterium]|nr:segregation/condensation protein A [Candidatus Hydrogenedentota bacterium]
MAENEFINFDFTRRVAVDAGQQSLDMVGDFLVMAATLMQIKSRMLLPPDPSEEEEIEEEAGEYREGDDEYDVVVKFPQAFRDDLAYLEGMSFVNPDGLQIPFTSVAKLERGVGLGSIKRVDRRRTITIKAEAEGDRSGTEVLSDVQDRLADLQLPPGYKIAYTGENDELVESGLFLMRAFIAALFLIALVLITQFNSIIQPFIIMSSVILSLGGVFFGLLIFDMPFGMLMTGIGCVSLSGIVVNNAIVLVDYINKLRERGMEVQEAIVTAGKIRFRPVILTAVTTILGLAPLGLGISFDFRNLEMVMGGEQASYWGSMAVAIIFGLSFATMLTLVVVPALYTLAVRFEKPGTFGGSDSGPPGEIDTGDVAS